MLQMMSLTKLASHSKEGIWGTVNFNSVFVKSGVSSSWAQSLSLFEHSGANQGVPPSRLRVSWNRSNLSGELPAFGAALDSSGAPTPHIITLDRIYHSANIQDVQSILRGVREGMLPQMKIISLN